MKIQNSKMALVLIFLHLNLLPMFSKKHQISEWELKFKVFLVISGPRQETIANENSVWKKSNQEMSKNYYRLSCIKTSSSQAKITQVNKVLVSENHHE